LFNLSTLIDENNSMKETAIPRVALIGATGYGRSHLDFILHNHEAGLWKFAAITIINPEEAVEVSARLEALGVHIYRDYKAMLAGEDGLELVCIPTAIHWHTPMTLDSLAAGANVYVEKPLAGSLGEAEEILAAREKSGRFVAVGFQHLYLSQTWQAKELILGGKIGRLKCLRGIASAPRKLSYFQRNGWAGKYHIDGHPVFDSPVNNAVSHYVNLMLFLAGPDRASSAKVEILEANLYRIQPIETFDTASIHGRTEQGADFFFHATHSAEEELHPLVRIEGESGAIEWAVDGGLRLEINGREVEEIAAPGFQDDPKTVRAAVLVGMLAGEKPDYCSVEIALEHVKFIDQLHRRFEPVEIAGDRKLLKESNQWVIPDLLPGLRRAFESNTLLDLHV
jgi:predicted dehydrogenase